MAQRLSRGTATLMALGVQGLIVLALKAGLATAPPPQSDVSALAIEILAARAIPELPTPPQAHLHLLEPGAPPQVAAQLAVIAPPEPPPDAADVLRTSDHSSAEPTVGNRSRIGIVSRVLPEYPRVAVHQRAQGITTVAIRVDDDGHPGEVRVLYSSGHTELDEAAVRAVRQWTFTAATLDARIVPSWARLEVNFTLSPNPQSATGPDGSVGKVDEDAVAKLAALIRSWGEHRSLELLSPALSSVLHKLGGVRAVRFLGIASHPPPSAGLRTAQQARMLDDSRLAGWDEFEVTHERGISQWYCAVDAAGRFQRILVDDE